jgi:hypothetical protein
MFVIEDHNIFVVLASGSLWAYRTEVIWNYFNRDLDSGLSSPEAPPRTKIAKSAIFFVVGRMKDRTLMIFGKKEGLHSTFKAIYSSHRSDRHSSQYFQVLEPIYYKPAKRTPFSFRSPKAEPSDIFREFDEFFLPMECFGINMFNQYLAVSTLKCFELLTLDRKFPFSVPDLKNSDMALIATRLQLQRPLGMFRLPAEEFFCCYEGEAQP